MSYRRIERDRAEPWIRVERLTTAQAGSTICAGCRRPFPFEIRDQRSDHIMPWSANAALAIPTVSIGQCRKGNGRKHAKPFYGWRREMGMLL